MRPLLVTAGATRNPVDAIRYLSANATGRTGIELASRLRPRFGGLVLGSAEATLRAQALGLPAEEFWGTRDLLGRMERWLTTNPGATLIHSAAVGDYEVPAEDLAAAGKIPSGQAEIHIRLVPAPKILDRVRGWCPDAFLVSFKAGRPGLLAEELEAIARAQLRRTGSDVVFANVLGRLQDSVLLVRESDTVAYARREDAVNALVESLLLA